MRSPHDLCRIALLALGLLQLSTLGHAQIPFTESWLANTYCAGTNNQPGKTPNFQMVSIGDSSVCAAASGTVYTNAGTDEVCVPVREYDNGVCGTGTGYAGFWGGNAIAANSSYLFYAQCVPTEPFNAPDSFPPSGTEWYGIVRRNLSNLNADSSFTGAYGGYADGQGTFAYVGFLLVNSEPSGTNAALMGVAANNTYLYASDPYNGRILQYNQSTMAQTATWSCANCAGMTVDGNGNLWVIQTGSTPQILCYNSNGTQQGSTLTFASGDIPTSIAYDCTNNRLLVTDNGPDCNIKVYPLPLAGGSPTPVSSSYGAVGGILSTANGHVKGQVDPLYFNHPLEGVAVDGSGNFTVLSGCAPVGQTLENYSASGTQNWVNEGLAFGDPACPDPGSDTDIYTVNQHFTMNYPNPPGQGSQWSYTGYTIDANKYGSSDERLYAGPNNGPHVVRIGGQKFLVRCDGLYTIAFYRFSPSTDGETAIPCAMISATTISGGNTNGWVPPNQPSGCNWIWTDTNGNGQMDAGEYQQCTPTQGYGDVTYYTVDSNGDVWGVGNGILHFKFQGLNNYGAPQYSFASGEFIDTPTPAPFYGVCNLAYMAFYDPATDALYISGSTEANPMDSCYTSYWGPLGPVLARYNTWSTNPTLAWQTTMPADSYSLDMAGQFLFAAPIAPAGTVYVIDKTTGMYAGSLSPSSTFLTGEDDVQFGLNAFQRSNGDYLLFQEDDGYDKVNMYTISHSAHLPPLVAISSPADRTAYAMSFKHSRHRNRVRGKRQLHHPGRVFCQWHPDGDANDGERQQL